MRVTVRALVLVLLAGSLLWALPGFAVDASPDEIPKVGTVAPAFGLFAFPTSKVASKKAESDDREVVQLDDICGLRPGKTKAVLVLFIDGDTGVLGAEPVGNWYRKYRKDGLEVVVISIEKSPSIFASKVLRTRPRYPILDDRHRVVAHRYGVQEAPFNFLLDSQCKVLGFGKQSATDGAPALNAAIEELVRGKAIPVDEEKSK